MTPDEMAAQLTTDIANVIYAAIAQEYAKGYADAKEQAVARITELEGALEKIKSYAASDDEPIATIHEIARAALSQEKK